MKISVIMPSFLGEYKNCATNREEKFKRAVQSFLDNTYFNKELIIVSDGCDITESIYLKKYSRFKNIIFKKIDKQPLFSGMVRNNGLAIASGDIVCYLDTDDFIQKTHLETIIKKFDLDWVYYDDYLVTRYTNTNSFTKTKRTVKVESCFIGTSSIAHKNGINASWGNGYGHDWRFVKQLMEYKSKKITGTGYMVCHQPKIKDL